MQRFERKSSVLFTTFCDYHDYESFLPVISHNHAALLFIMKIDQMISNLLLNHQILAEHVKPPVNSGRKVRRSLTSVQVVLWEPQTSV